jgi:hypothetical protein
MRFECDERKGKQNLAKHDVDFQTAELVFDDPYAVTIRDVAYQPVVKVRTRSFTLNSPDFVIPSAARDLQFAAKMQIPRCARDDNS